MKIYNNTMSKPYFISEIVFWLAFAMISFRSSLFKCFDTLTLSQSKFYLWGIVIISVIIGLLLTFKRRRNNYSLIAIISIPFGIYGISTFGKYHLSFLCVMSTLFVLIFGYYIFRIFFVSSNKQSHSYNLKKRFIKLINRTHVIIGLLLAVYLVFTWTSHVLGNGFYPSSIKAEKASLSSQFDSIIPIANNLQEEKWEKLSSTERINTLQRIANYECNNLSLDNELNIVVDITNDNLIAFYNPQTHSIIINIDCFNNCTAEEMVECICHEARHSFQHMLVKQLNNNTIPERYIAGAKLLKEEFCNYTSACEAENFDTYYSQLCESDSRSYSNDESRYIINKYVYNYYNGD